MRLSSLKNLNNKLIFLPPNHLPMKTLWCKNQENLRDRISHAWAPLSSLLGEPKAIKGCGAKDSAQLGSKLLRYYTSVVEVTRSRMQAQ
jgi:hypothetical protein